MAFLKILFAVLLLPTLTFAAKIPVDQAQFAADDTPVDQFQISTSLKKALQRNNVVNLKDLKQFVRCCAVNLPRLITLRSVHVVMQLAGIEYTEAPWIPVEEASLLPDETSVYNVQISTRLRNSLLYAQFFTLGEARSAYLARGREAFLRIPKLGRTSMEEFEAIFKLSSPVDVGTLTRFNVSKNLIAALRAEGIRTLDELNRAFSPENLKAADCDQEMREP